MGSTDSRASNRRDFIKTASAGATALSMTAASYARVVGANDRLSIGFQYKSAIDIDFAGEAEFSQISTGDPVFDAIVAGSLPDSDVPITTSIEFPDQASLGVAYRFTDKWLAEFDLGWTGWSTFNAFAVRFDNPAQPSVNQPANWNDTWRVGVGGIFSPDEKWTLRLGAAYEQTAVPDSTREPRVPVEDRYWLTLGASYAISDKVELDVAYLQWFSPDASINVTSPEQGNLVGSVDWFVASIGATLTFRF